MGCLQCGHFRAEALNAFNHPQFGAPNATEGSSIMGVITNTTIHNRELQLALKYMFQLNQGGPRLCGGLGAEEAGRQ